MNIIIIPDEKWCRLARLALETFGIWCEVSLQWSIGEGGDSIWDTIKKASPSKQAEIVPTFHILQITDDYDDDDDDSHQEREFQK